MKLLELDILTYGTLAQARLDLSSSQSPLLWVGEAEELQQILAFIVFIFYGQPDESIRYAFQLPNQTLSKQTKAIGGSISFSHKGELYLLERLTNGVGERDSIKLLNETSSQDLSDSCSLQPGRDLFDLGPEEFAYCLNLIPLPDQDFFDNWADRVESSLVAELDVHSDRNNEKNSTAILEEKIARVENQIEVLNATEETQAQLVEQIYQQKQNIKQHEKQLEEINPRIEHLELLEDKARYENLLILRTELAEVEAEADNLVRMAQEKNLPSALELTSYEDFYEDWNQKARKLSELRIQQVSITEEVKERFQTCNNLKQELDKIEQIESGFRRQLQNEDKDLKQAQKEYEEKNRRSSGLNRYFVLIALAFVAGLILIIADILTWGAVLIGVAFVAALLLIGIKARGKIDKSATLARTRDRIKQIQRRISAVEREKSDLIWQLEEELVGYQEARKAENSLMTQLPRVENSVKAAGYELVTSLSRYVRIHYPEEAARALRELRERVIDSMPVDEKASRILSQITALKSGKTDEEIEQDYEYAIERLFGSALNGQNKKGLPSVATSRYNPEVLSNARATKLRLELELDQSVNKMKNLSEELIKTFSAVNLADLYRHQKQLEQDKTEINDRMAAIRNALAYLDKAKPYRSDFYSQIKERADQYSEHILRTGEHKLGNGLTRALALRSITVGGQNMPLFIDVSIPGGWLCDLPARLQSLGEDVSQLIFLQEKGDDLPSGWSPLAKHIL